MSVQPPGAPGAPGAPGPTGATGPEATAEAGAGETDQTLARLRRELEAERAGASHWRDVARRRDEALTQIKGRTSVRAVLALDHRTSGLRRRVRASAADARRTAGRLALAASAVGSRPDLARRRARLDAAVDAAGREASAGASTRTTLVVVTGRTTPPAWADALPAGRVRVVAVPDTAAVPAALAGADTDLICLVDGDVEPLTAGWLDHLDRALVGPAAAATGVLVHPARPPGRATPHDLLVRAAGYEVTASAPGVPRVVAALAGADPAAVPDGPVVLAGGGLLAVLRPALDAAGGYRPLVSADAAAADLCLRLGRSTGGGGGTVVRVGAALALDHRPVEDRDALHRPFDEAGPAWAALLAASGPALRRAGPDGPDAPLSFTLTVAAPTPKVAERWGDWHLAEALARALEARGHPARVGTLAEVADPAARAADVHVVLRGLAAVARTSGQRHVLWVISHPEDLDVDECDRADLVLVASATFATELRSRTATPVDVLLQATDATRFRPLPVDPAHRHDVTVVGKSRDVLRPMVADALAAGLRPAIHGSGWDHLVDPALVVTDHVDNRDLPTIYASAGVVLNDHWDTMRAWGFISNRVFDVLACGTPVISDPVPGLREAVGDLVPTWTTPDELRRAVETALAADRTAFAAQARAVVTARHTFAQRAAEIEAALDAHGLTGPGGPA
ncbi:MAG TPA: glycosyltransferase [Acidimicrobiales bacterium]|nr:glycosyltransferase [Acidimicrobiales bacterium]